MDLISQVLLTALAIVYVIELAVFTVLKDRIADPFPRTQN
jgi:hypothetical protein